MSSFILESYPFWRGLLAREIEALDASPGVVDIALTW
jgi:hypothetical protein